jgi:hypothetical protein
LRKEKEIGRPKMIIRKAQELEAMSISYSPRNQGGEEIGDKFYIDI